MTALETFQNATNLLSTYSNDAATYASLVANGSPQPATTNAYNAMQTAFNNFMATQTDVCGVYKSYGGT